MAEPHGSRAPSPQAAHVRQAAAGAQVRTRPPREVLSDACLPMIDLQDDGLGQSEIRGFGRKSV